MRIWLIMLSCLITMVLFSQEERKHIRAGNSYYYDGKLTEAELEYNKALELKSDLFEGLLNKGDVYYQRDSFSKAADQFDIAAGITSDKKQKAMAYHNKGTSLLQASDYEGSIEAFKQALRNNPADEDTRYNLSYAMAKLKEQQQQEQQNKENKQEDEEGEDDEQNKSQQNEDQEKNEDQEDKQGQDNKDPKDSKEGENGQNNEPEKSDEQQQQEREAQPREGQLSKEEAKRLLEALQNEEQKVQRKLQKVEKKGEKRTIEKDW